jgi:hypothetical protein
MAVYFIGKDLDLASKLISYGLKNFICDKSLLVHIPEKAKLICKDEVTGELSVKTKQEYLTREKTSKLLILYEVLVDDGFDWDKAIAQAIGLEEAPEDPTGLIEEIKHRLFPEPLNPSI